MALFGDIQFADFNGRGNQVRSFGGLSITTTILGFLFALM